MVEIVVVPRPLTDYDMATLGQDELKEAERFWNAQAEHNKGWRSGFYSGLFSGFLTGFALSGIAFTAFWTY